MLSAGEGRLAPVGKLIFNPDALSRIGNAVFGVLSEMKLSTFPPQVVITL